MTTEGAIERAVLLSLSSGLSWLLLGSLIAVASGSWLIFAMVAAGAIALFLFALAMTLGINWAEEDE